MASRKESIPDDAYKLCYSGLPSGFEKYIRKVVLPQDNVLLYKKGNKRGHCYCCHKDVTALPGQKFSQLSRYGHCPECGEVVDCVLEDGARFGADYVEDVAAMQIGRDGKTVFIRQYHLIRDPEDKYEHIEHFLEEIARYAIRGNLCAKWQHECKWNWGCGLSVVRENYAGWERYKNVSELYDGQMFLYISEKTAERLKDTSLKYVPINDVHDKNHRIFECDRNTIRLLMDWVRYPAIEKLFKAGYRQIVFEKTSGQLSKETRNCLKWSAKEFRDIFPFPTHYLKVMRPEDWNCMYFRRMKEAVAAYDAGAVRAGEIEELFGSDMNIDYIRDALGHASVFKIERYYNTLDGGHGAFLWRDYLHDAILLKYNLDDESVLFPKDLAAAHARQTSIIKYEKNKLLKSAFKEKYKTLSKYAYSDNVYSIRPAKNQTELSYEGIKLHHCVGGYAEKIAKGMALIFFIRKNTEPDVPFYTLELNSKKELVQCHTAYNEDYKYNKDVHKFVQDWLKTVNKPARRA